MTTSLGRRLTRCLMLAAAFVLSNDAAADNQERSAKAGPKDPLEPALQASLAVEKIKSAIAVGTFEMHVKDDPAEKEPMLRTKAKVKLYFDQGKYHLRFDYETKLVRTTYLDRKGNETVTRLAEWKPDDFVAIYDGKACHCVTFSTRIRPTGCQIEVFDPPNHIMWGLPWTNPAQLGHQLLHVNKLLKSLGRGALTTSALPGGGQRIAFQAKNSSKVRCEADVLPAIDFNVAQCRWINEGFDKPAITKTAIWKKAKDQWYVQQLTEERHFRPGQPDEMVSRSVLRYDTFDVNSAVDPKLFTLDCLDIPAGTRTLDRRRP